MKDNVILIGMPGAGKSTVGVLLAKALGYDYLDTDLLICRNYKMTLQELIAKKGIDFFLHAEEETGSGIYCRKTVIATGGSMVLSPKAMAHLKQRGMVFYLEVPFDILKKRIRNIKTRGIAFLPGETLEDVFRKREALYHQYADVVISYQSEIELTIDKIYNCIKEVHVHEKHFSKD